MKSSTSSSPTIHTTNHATRCTIKQMPPSTSVACFTSRLDSQRCGNLVRSTAVGWHFIVAGWWYSRRQIKFCLNGWDLLWVRYLYNIETYHLFALLYFCSVSCIYHYMVLPNSSKSKFDTIKRKKIYMKNNVDKL